MASKIGRPGRLEHRDGRAPTVSYRLGGREHRGKLDRLQPCSEGEALHGLALCAYAVWR